LRKLISIASMLAMLALMASPALAQDFDRNDFDDDGGRAFFFDDDNDDNDNDDNDNDIFDNNRFFGFDNGFDNDIFDDNGFFGSGGFEQETDETGDVSLSTEVVQTGNNSNQCVAPLQFGNTGNLQNEQGFVTLGSPSDNGFFDDNFDNNGFFDFNNGFDSNLDDVEFEGSTFEFAPEQAVQCDQAVQQSAAASG
jgi:hypothetical protein